MFFNKEEQRKRKVYTHAPFSFTHDDGTVVSVSKDGRVTIRRDLENGEYDEIEVSAKLIFRTVSMLNATVRVKYEPFEKESKE